MARDYLFVYLNLLLLLLWSTVLITILVDGFDAIPSIPTLCTLMRKSLYYYHIIHLDNK